MNPISIPYDPQFYRTQAHHSNLYFGASIAALRLLASRKGYNFVGTNSTGVNAFFVRNDYAMHLADAIRNASPWPSRSRESRDAHGQFTYVSGLDRLDLIAHLPVVNVETGRTMRLGEVGRLYSEEWIKEICAGYSAAEPSLAR